MFEAGLPFFLCLVDSVTGGIYAWKLLKGKYEKKIVLPVWICLYFFAQLLPSKPLSGTHPADDLIRAAADITVIFLLEILLYKKDIVRQLFAAVSFEAGKEIIKYIIVVISYGEYWLCNKILSALSEKITTVEKTRMWIFISNEAVWVISLLLYALFMTVFFSLISRKFVKRDYPLKVQESAFFILPGAATLCVSITLRILILTVEDGAAVIMFEKIPQTMFWVPLICLLLLGVNISSVILFQKLVHLSEERQKRGILENQMVQMQQKIEEIQDIYADMRGLRHDMKCHLESITALVKRTSGENKKELDDYIEKMTATVHRLDFAYNTGNPITDVILHQKQQEAGKRKIAFEADFTFPVKQQIDVYDIGIVLNNALTNAIEACGRIEGEKSIRLCSYMKGNLFFIEVENDFSGELIWDSKTVLPVSGKADRQLHGLGMENIRRCAKKYMGDIDIAVYNRGDRKKFCLTVMMYEKSSTGNCETVN